MFVRHASNDKFWFCLLCCVRQWRKFRCLCCYSFDNVRVPFIRSLSMHRQLMPLRPALVSSSSMHVSAIKFFLLLLIRKKDLVAAWWVWHCDRRTSCAEVRLVCAYDAIFFCRDDSTTTADCIGRYSR